MNKVNLLHSIPAYYRNRSYLLKISQLIANSQVRLSSLVINQKNEKQSYLLLKEGNIYLREDWEAFSLLRASAKLLLSSGQNLRKQPQIYKHRQGYGNQDIEDLNQALLGQQKQKVFVFTKSLPVDKIQPYLNESYYDLIQLPHYESVYNAIQMLRQKQENIPITIEFGMELIGQYFNEVNKGKKTQIDALLLSKFTAENISKFKGNKSIIPIDKYYNMEWKSEDIHCKLVNGIEGVLTFQFYSPKK